MLLAIGYPGTILPWAHELPLSSLQRVKSETLDLTVQGSQPLEDMQCVYMLGFSGLKNTNTVLLEDY